VLEDPSLKKSRVAHTAAMRVLILSSLTGSCLLYQSFGPEASTGEDGPTGARLSSTLFCMNRLVSKSSSWPRSPLPPALG
jgi:hypothetical protein